MTRSIPSALLAMAGLASSASAQSSLNLDFLFHNDGRPIFGGEVVTGIVFASWSAPNTSSNFVGVASGSFKLRVTASNPTGGVFAGPVGAGVEPASDNLNFDNPSEPDTEWMLGRRPGVMQGGIVTGGFRNPANGTGPAELNYQIQDDGAELTALSGDGTETGIQFGQLPRAVIGSNFTRLASGFELFRFALQLPFAPMGYVTVTPTDLAGFTYYTSAAGATAPFESVTGAGQLTWYPAPSTLPVFVLGGLVAARRRRGVVPL